MSKKRKQHNGVVRKITWAFCMLFCAVFIIPALTVQAASDLSKYNAQNFISPFCEGMASVYTENGWGFIDKTGKEVIKPEYNYVSNPFFSDGLAFVGKDGKYGFIDKNGDEVIKLQYDSYGDMGFSDGLALLVKNGKSVYINKKGKEVLKVDYDSAGPFKDGLDWHVFV